MKRKEEGRGRGEEKTNSERSGSVTSGSPGSSSVEREPFVLDDLEEPSGTESFGVGSEKCQRSGSILFFLMASNCRLCSGIQYGRGDENVLSLDLEDIEGKKNDLSNTGKATDRFSGRVSVSNPICFS